MRSIALFLAIPVFGQLVTVDPAFNSLVSADAKIEKLGGGMKFTEGPVWVKDHLLFSDIPANAIRQWSAKRGISVFRQPVFPGKFNEGEFVGSNGLTLDKQRRLVSAEHANRRVARAEKDGKKITVIAEKWEGLRLNSPNDVVYRSNGDLYFTDPPYGFAKQDDDPAKELKFNGVFRVTAAGELQLLVREMTRPNGIAFSPDEKRLYLANSDPAKKLWMVYDLTLNGRLANPRVFADVTKEAAEGLPDGLKVDKQGNLWATGPGGIWVFSPSGKILGKIQPPEVPANCAWGDQDGKTLYMTARTGLYRVRTLIGGKLP